MIRLSQLTLRRGAKVLLEQTDLALNPGDHAGLIGANGSGKSSLFALLRDELHADKGDVDMPKHWRIAHVAQETPALERPAVEYAIDGDRKLRALEAELEATHDGNRMAELHAALADADVYTVKPEDTLSSIAQEFYGDPERFRTIFQANRNILDDPDEIFPGQELRIPQ